MSFNQYSIYSALSATEEKDENNTKKLIDLSYSLKNISDYNEVKELLESEFNVVDYLSSYRLGCDASLNISEDRTLYSVNLTYGNENRTYTYKK